MLLSIVLMVKNEEQFLEKTLKALDELRNKIDSELIILDTGSTDSTVEIAKKFTDKVYFDKWNNDFANMRNKSISYAKGEWLLILDADEELLDDTKIINFFESGLYKEYNCASVVLRNIHSEDLKEYTDANNLRMFKRKGFRYEGAIHEQPKYKTPIYNNIAAFNHYGYLYADEDFKQKKLKRNETILLKELKKNPNQPYINFQLGKNYLSLGNKEEALYYMEKSMEEHKKEKCIPEYLYSNLVNVYRELNKFDEAEKICIEYIKNIDDKNIDIYYYLALVHQRVYKYKESIESFKRYIYLIDNYSISTQATSIFADGVTVGLKEKAELGIIENYFYLNEFNKIAKAIKNLSIDQMKSIYHIVIISLIKVNKIDELVNIYNEKLTSEVEKTTFKTNLENVMFRLTKNEKLRLFKALSSIPGNYGTLNKVRLGLKLSKDDINEILKDENYNYYSDLIYYGMNQGYDLIELLKGVSNIDKEKYLQYLVLTKKNKVGEIYDYVINYKSTLQTEKLALLSLMAKILLKGTTISKEKYKKLFNIYINYEYLYLKSIYKGLSDKDIMYYSKDSDEIFVINLKLINDIKNEDKIKYVKEIKELILKYPNFKDGVEEIIEFFKKEISESDEVKNMRNRFIEIIKEFINIGNIGEAEQHIEIYKETFGIDNKIMNLISVLYIIKGEFINADQELKKIFILDPNNFDAIFNIAYVKRGLGEYDEAINFLNYIIENCDDENLIEESKIEIKGINGI